VCEDEADQQRLLFAGRGVAGRHLLRRVDHLQVGQMRAIEGAAGGGVAHPVAAQQGAVAVLHRGCGLAEQRVLHPAVERDLRGRKRRGLAPRAQHRCELDGRLPARGRDGDRELRGLPLDRIAPVIVVIADFEQPVARPQRAFERRDAARMLAVDREHQPVEEAPPLRCGAHEQAVHGGSQPHHAQVIAEGCR